MKKKTLIITGAVAASVTLLILLSIGLTGAYLSDVKDVTNQISVTEGKIDISESFPSVTEQSMNNTFKKEVKVSNTSSGTTDCFVRVFADFSDSNVRDKAKIRVNSTDYTWTEFIALTNRSDNWEFIPDNSSENEKLRGYFYYKKVLHSGETTPDLFTDVLVDYRDPPGSGADTNIDKITDFEMIVYAETVQTTEINASGTVYNDTQWKDAWKSFLKITS